ncbi:MAG TPA: hypothetical protein ENK18_27280 [Deltaproteobacteria bacterium]|nr:hypothetical protein [Deltaproteobacteria bacterium]
MIHPPAPRRPVVPPVGDAAAWGAQLQLADRSWRARSLEAVAALGADRPGAQGQAAREQAVEVAVVQLVDRISAARQRAREGQLAPIQLREEISAARREASEALLRATEGDVDAVRAIWGALQEASSPL